jgi:hypothetical protein
VSLTIQQAVLILTPLEYISAQKSKGEVLVFQRGRIPKELKEKNKGDAEEGKGSNGSGKAGSGEHKEADTSIIQRQTAIFSWKDVVYDIKIKKETRRILDHVDGWVKPGTLTALMVCPIFEGDCGADEFRVSLVLVKPLYSMFWLPESLWVLSLVKCSSMADSEMSLSSERPDTSNSKTCISKLRPSGRLYDSPPSYDSPTRLQ